MSFAIDLEPFFHNKSDRNVNNEIIPNMGGPTTAKILTTLNCKLEGSSGNTVEMAEQ